MKDKDDIQIARALGIRAKQEGLECDSVLTNVDMRLLCTGRNARMTRAFISAFIAGWEVQTRVQVNYGRAGSRILATRTEAQKFIRGLPENYRSEIQPGECGKWIVAYRREAVK